MLARLLTVGLAAGFAAGLAIAMLQHFTTTPLIIQAERYEIAQAAAPVGQARLILVDGEAESAAHDHGAEAWAPADGLSRTVFTSIATIGTAVGFAFLLIAGMLLAGDRIGERVAVAWAAAGFAATGLAPGLGLSPELPGMPAADLAWRQLWWVATALATGAGLWLLLRTEALWLKAAAVALLVAPHAAGAPHLAEPVPSLVPAHLSASFAATSLAVQAALWLATGFLVGLLWSRLEAADADAGGAVRA